MDLRNVTEFILLVCSMIKPKIIYARDWDTHTTRWNSQVHKYVGRLCGAVAPVVNRTGHGNLFAYEYSKIPEDHHTKMSFGDCALEAAENLWKRGKPIKLAWSGGIDSTVALVALIETRGSNDVLDVIFTEESIDEYPRMYDERLRGIWEPVSYDSLYDKRHYTEQWLSISGDCGDQVFGSDTVLNRDEALTSPWHELFDYPLKSMYSPAFNYISTENESREKQMIFEYLSHHEERCPFELHTILDMYWWVNFTLKWQHIRQRHWLIFSGGDLKHTGEPFYDTPNFQRWSLTNHDLKHEGSWQTYKQPAKNFIHSLFPDEDHRKNKTKVGSGQRSRRWRNADFSPQLILTDGRTWTKNEIIPRSVDEELRLTDVHHIV